MIIFILTCSIWRTDEKKAFISFSFFLISIAVGIMTYTHATVFFQHLIPAVVIWIMAGLCLLDRLESINIKGRLFKIEIAAVSLYMFMFLNAGLNTTSLINTDVVWRQKSYQDTLISAIPETDYDSVYCLDINCAWYYVNHIYPAYRYLNLSGFINYSGGVSGVVAKDFESELMDNPAKWLIIPSDLDNYQDILTEKTILFIRDNFKCKEVVDDYDAFHDYYIYQLL